MALLVTAIIGMTPEIASATAFLVGVLGCVSISIIWYKTAGEHSSLSDRVFSNIIRAFAVLAVIGGGIWLLVSQDGSR